MNIITAAGYLVVLAAITLRAAAAGSDTLRVFSQTFIDNCA